MAAELRHVLVIEDDRGFQEYVLDASMYTLGRDPTCDIRVISRYVSRRHATLVQIPGPDERSFHYRLVDGTPKGKPSSNGIAVNSQKVRACDLQDSDEILLGYEVRAIYRLMVYDRDRLPESEQTIVPEEHLSRV